MKFFFTSAIQATEGGEAHSAESVRHKIRQLIDAETRERDVHSDDSIVDILKAAGVDIARRTVAKYREAMRIPSSVERRRRLKDQGGKSRYATPGAPPRKRRMAQMPEPSKNQLPALRVLADIANSGAGSPSPSWP
jgi:hypothetical protein